MSGSFIQVEIEGGNEIREAINRLAERGQDLRPVFADIGEYLHQAHYERFKQGVDPEGNDWTPLNPDYQKRKEANKDKILILGDVLGFKLAPQPTAETLLFGTNLDYGATHQFGRGRTARKKTGTVYDAKIPARPFLGLSDADVDEVKWLLGEWLTGAEDGAE